MSAVRGVAKRSRTPRPRRAVRSRGDGAGEVRARLRRAEQALAEAQQELARRPPAPPRDGLLVGLARLAQSGLRSVGWQALGRLQAALYFSWHSEQVDEFGFDSAFSDALKPFLDFLYSAWWRVDVAGMEHVPDDGPGLIVANHSGVLPYDGAMVKLAIRNQHARRRECRMLMLDMFALLPFLAPALTKHGEVRASPDNAERLLRGGSLVGVFPEGVKGVGKYFRDRYRLARFGRGGFVRVALRTGAPIIPCAVVGAEEIHPIVGRADWIGRRLGFPYFPLTPTFPWLGPLGLVPLPTKWSIDFGQPILPSEYGPEGADDPILVNRLSEEVRARVQEMIDGRIARRRSLWFG